MRRLPSRPPRSRPVRLLLPLCATVGLLASVAASCGSDPTGIEVGQAQVATVTEVVDAPASVTARAAATLTAPAAGTLAELLVGPGDQVRPGQVVAVVSSPEARDRLADATTALNAANRAGGGGLGRGVDLSGTREATDAAAAHAFATARAAAAKISDVGVRDALLAQVTLAEKQYAAASATAARAVQSVRQGISAVSSALGTLGSAQKLQARQAYDLAKSTVDALTLRAPIAGVVQLGGAASTGAAGPSLTDLLGGAAPGLPETTTSTLPAGVSDALSVGSLIGAGTAVATIVDVRELGLVAEVDETDVLLVQPGVTASVELDAAPGVRYEATVRSVDVLPTPSARGGVSYRVRLTLGDGAYGDGRPAPVPRPGMSAVAHLSVREARDTVAVPAAAVFTVDGQDSVWAVRDGRAQRVAVTIGVPGQDLVQILAGLTAGERVVVRGTDQVRAGAELS